MLIRVHFRVEYQSTLSTRAESNYTQNHACIPGGGVGKSQRPREEQAGTMIP